MAYSLPALPNRTADPFMNRNRPGARLASRIPSPSIPHVLLLAACLSLLIPGCGNRGPLYLPETGAAPEQSTVPTPDDSTPGAAGSDSEPRAASGDNGDEDGRDDDNDDSGDSGQRRQAP